MVHTHGVRGSIPFSATDRTLSVYALRVLYCLTENSSEFPVKQKNAHGGIYMRIGTGYDVHRVTDNRKMIIGGVEIPYEKGLLGHSDADVLLHAIMDSLLGAAALGDIGKHFPDSDEKYKGISSLILLEKVGDILSDAHFIIENIDSTIIAQRPKMAPYIETMRENIAKALKIPVSSVSVKATTEEGLGFTGSGEGIAAQAVSLLTTVENYVYADVMNMNRGCEGCSGCRK